MRRDTSTLRENDTFAVVFDTFYDRRNGVPFYTNPLGALADFAITNEGNPNSDWNPSGTSARGGSKAAGRSKWRFRSNRSGIGPGPAQVWGILLRRALRRMVVVSSGASQ